MKKPVGEAVINRVHSIKLAYIPVALAVLLIVAYIAFFGLYKELTLGDPESWGQFGDFLGGVLNPVVGIVTILLLVSTLVAQRDAIALQQHELKMQREELKLQREESAKATKALNEQRDAILRQSFEHTFFTWLQNFRVLVSEVSLGEVNGTRYFRGLASNLKADRMVEIYDPQSAGFYRPDTVPLTSYPKAISDYQSGIDSDVLINRLLRAISSYQEVYRENHLTLGPFFRTAYRLLNWIDTSPLSEKEKWHYVAIVRSQLSWGEMVIVLFNGLTQRGASLAALADKYALFDNLEEESDELVGAMKTAFTQKQPDPKLFDLNVWPYSEKAFTSSTAKLALGFLDAKDL